MDELEERRELDRLIAEQEKDDSTVILPERGHESDIDIGVFTDSFSVTDVYFAGSEDQHPSDEDAEPVIDLPRQKGAVLVGGASWHGTLDGYNNHKCHCDRCKAAYSEWKRQYRARKKQEASA